MKPGEFYKRIKQCQGGLARRLNGEKVCHFDPVDEDQRFCQHLGQIISYRGREYYSCRKKY